MNGINFSTILLLCKPSFLKLEMYYILNYNKTGWKKKIPLHLNKTPVPSTERCLLGWMFPPTPDTLEPPSLTHPQKESEQAVASNLPGLPTAPVEGYSLTHLLRATLSPLLPSHPITSAMH